MTRTLPWLLALALILAQPPSAARACPQAGLSAVERPALNSAEGPALSAVEGPSQRASPTLRPRDQSAEPPSDTFHIVQRGETLFSIAQRYGSTVEALAHANGLVDPNRVYVGQRLRIPGGELEIDPRATSAYLVQTGDTLLSIATHYATSWRALAQVNAMLSPDALRTGQVIQVPLVEGRAEARRGVLHVVYPDETLFEIALRHDLLPWSVANANGVSNRALIFPGQQLLIPGEEDSRLPAPFTSVVVHPLPVSQGETLIVSVWTAKPVALSGELFERSVEFSEENGIYYALAGVHVFTEPGLYEMVLTATDGDGRTTDITADVVVQAGHFGYERIPAAPSLLDPAIIAAERELLDALRPTFTASRGWSGAIQRPSSGTVSSYFGTHRAYNEGPYTSYHTGVDLRGPTGTPVYAPAGGTVVMAEELAVRGNAVVLDHGWGVLTGYWHLSAIEAQVGQKVAQGDLIARIGSTGLSTGAHLHWEMWVGSVNVNPLQWLEPFYPWPDPAGASLGGNLP
jgi:murein DD-endopeptidase MepM/ murein hydrolase activator NlpD